MNQYSVSLLVCLLLFALCSCRTGSDQQKNIQPTDDQTDTSGEAGGTAAQEENAAVQNEQPEINRCFKHDPVILVDEADFPLVRLLVAKNDRISLVSNEGKILKELITGHPVSQVVMNNKSEVFVKEDFGDTSYVSVYDLNQNNLFTLHALTSDDLASAGLSEEEELYGWRVLDCSNRDTLYYQVSFIFPGFEEGEPPWLLLGYITGSRQYFRAEDYLAGTRPPVYSTREAEEVFSRLAKVGDYLSVQSGGDQWKKIFDRKEYFGGNACGLCLVSPDGRSVVYEWCSDWLEGCDYVPFLIEPATKKYRPLTGAGTFHWLSSDRLIYKKYKSGNYDAIYEVRGLELEPEILVDSIYDFILVRQ